MPYSLNQSSRTLRRPAFLSHCLLALSLTTLAALGQTAPRGTVTGTVFDAANGLPIPLITIEVNGMTDGRQQTGTDGKFTIQLSPGKYKLRFTGTNHLEAAIEDIEVIAGQVVEASTVMQQKGAVTTVEVSEKVGAVQSTAESILQERKLASNTSDSISKDDIKGSTASDAAGALEKVTGVSIVDNGYVFVRGLGERYSSTMLNNAVIPTTEPERRVVPLDLFPASLIDNIKVLKTYSPDLPGEFSGGLVQLQTVEFPTAPNLQVSVNYGFNSQTTFNRFAGQFGGARDFFGVDDGTRALPSVFPEDKRLFQGNFSESQIQQFGRAFSNNYQPKFTDSMRPQQSYSVSGGTSIGKWGFVGALTFANTPQRTPQLQRFLVNSGGGRPAIFSDYNDFNVDTIGARVGGVLNAAYRVNANNKLIFRNTLTRDSDQETRVIRGLNGGNGQEIESTRLRWVERQLLSTGIEGDHAFSKLGNSIVHWQFTYSTSKRDEPDLRETIRGREPGSREAFTYINLPESGFRFFNNLADKIYEPQADWTKPFYNGKVSGIFKVGFRGTVRRRDFDGRRFRYFPVRAGTIDFTRPTNDILGPNNIRPDGFALREITRGTDKYAAEMDVYGGYAMADIALGPKWRVIGGMRYEDANILVTTNDPLVPGSVPTRAMLSNRDPLPAVSLIYQKTARQNIRFGFGRTVNRPDFRELSPFEFTNVVGGYSTVGNPDLQRATIDNFDARWEWFLGGNQVIAASYFYKKFSNPIEQTYRPTASELRQSFINVGGANNQGIELEMRKNLGFVNKKMTPFSVQSNFTFVNSNVSILESQKAILTSLDRPLVGQSRFIYNAIAEWLYPKLHSNARFYVNSVSRRITDVGTFRLPDVYQERTTFVDFVYQVNLDEKGKWNVRFSGENLTDNRYWYTQSTFVVRDFKIGRTFTIGTSYSFF